MKAPAFQFYADDFIGGTITMSHQERGLYILLLCLQWTQGKITADDIAHLSAETPQHSVFKVRSKFLVSEDGGLRNQRLEQERAKQAAFRVKKEEAGKAGAEKRWHNHSTPIVLPMANGMANGMANDSSPSPSPSPKEEEEPKKNRKSFDVSAIEIPEALNTAGFLNAWDRWCDHRREMKKPLTKTSTEHQLKELAGMGESRAIAALHHSVKNGWQGIYEPTKTATASEVPSGPRSWRNTPSSEWTPEDHAAYEKA